MIPANTIAETVVRLRLETEAYLEQIEKNEQLLEALEPLAEWKEPEEATAPIVAETNA